MILFMSFIAHEGFCSIKNNTKIDVAFGENSQTELDHEDWSKLSSIWRPGHFGYGSVLLLLWIYTKLHSSLFSAGHCSSAQEVVQTREMKPLIISIFVGF